MGPRVGLTTRILDLDMPLKNLSLRVHFFGTLGFANRLGNPLTKGYNGVVVGIRGLPLFFFVPNSRVPQSNTNPLETLIYPVSMPPPISFPFDSPFKAGLRFEDLRRGFSVLGVPLCSICSIIKTLDPKPCK